MIAQKTYTIEEATKKLEQYCVYQERCHKDVRKKLLTMHMIPEAIDLIIVHLLEHSFLNEARFAKVFVRGKFNIKRWGRHRLTLELKQREVSEFNINQALADIEDSEYIEVFTSITEKKYHTLNETNILKKRKKFIDYFLYRGWESHLVYEKAFELIK